jgi:recombinase
LNLERKHTKLTAPAPQSDYRSAMGSTRKKSLVKKRRAVAMAFASAVRELQASGVVTGRAIADELNRRGVATERNGRWHNTTVVRMLTRLGIVKSAAGDAGAGAASRHAALVRAQTLAPLIRQIRLAGTVTPKAIAMELNALGIRTPRGGKWHPTTVGRLLSRLQRLGVDPLSQGHNIGRRARQNLPP